MVNVFLELEGSKPREKITPFENFTTTALKICLETDKRFVSSFVNLIIKNSKKKYYPPYKPFNQEQIKDSIIDLVIKDKYDKKLLIEIKTGSTERRYEDEKGSFGQIEKYCRLNKGEVVFLTDSQANIKVVKNKHLFLGQYLWFQVWELLNKYNQFLLADFKKFLEENKMGYEGFTKKSIKDSSSFFELKSAIPKTVDMILKRLGSSGTLKRYNLEIKDFAKFRTWSSYEFTLIRDLKSWNNHKSHVGIGIQDYGDEACFFVDFRIRYMDHSKFREDEAFNNLLKSLKKKKWEECDNRGDWSICIKSFELSKLKNKTPEMQLKMLLAFTEKAIKELTRVFNYIGSVKF